MLLYVPLLLSPLRPVFFHRTLSLQKQRPDPTRVGMAGRVPHCLRLARSSNTCAPVLRTGIVPPSVNIDVHLSGAQRMFFLAARRLARLARASVEIRGQRCAMPLHVVHTSMRGR